MIKSITLKNFKSYAEAELPLAPLTILIGANASGKSNALEALRFLNWLAEGQQLSYLQYMVNTDDDRFVRGNAKDLFRFGQKSFTLGCTFGREKFNVLDVEIEQRQDGELHVAHEAMYHLRKNQDPYYLYRTVNKSEGDQTGIRAEYNNFARGGKNPQFPATDQKALFLQLDSPARFPSSQKTAIETIPAAVTSAQRQLAGILFLDPTPHKMRDSSYASDRILRNDGANLSGVIHNLWEKGSDDQRAALLSFVKTLPEHAITSFEFLTGTKGDVLLQAVETFGNTSRTVDATLLSDGTLRVLAFAAALLTAPEGSLVIIEEMDNGLHPSRANMLLNAVQKLARQRKLSVLISSHNPALLDALPDESVPDVVFCYRDPDSGSSKLIRMRDINDYVGLMLRGTLGELLTQGLVDRYAKSKTSEKERIEAGLEWLESLQEPAES